MERTEQFSVTHEEVPKAFSLILTGVTLEYYFTNVRGIVIDFRQMVNKMQHRLLTEERTLFLTQEWESTILEKLSRRPLH